MYCNTDWSGGLPIDWVVSIPLYISDFPNFFFGDK